jgi:TetR/AcrR family transcriptional repressor of nem operon
MDQPMNASPQQHSSKTRLLDAALTVIRTKGYAATTVDDICHAAGVTKGSFFHHFKSKDERRRLIARRAIRWSGCSATSTSAPRC